MAFILYDPSFALGLIKPRLAEAFRLRFIDGLTYREVAIGLSVSALKSLPAGCAYTEFQIFISRARARQLVLKAICRLKYKGLWLTSS